MISQIAFVKLRKNCEETEYLRGLMKLGYTTNHQEDEQGIIWFKDRICVPSDPALREEILSEAHDSKYGIHPGGSKMYQDLKKHFLVERHEDRHCRTCGTM